MHLTTHTTWSTQPKPAPGRVSVAAAAYRELEMLVILRMNRDFMDFMRTNYAAEASKYMKQQFGCTVVKAESDQ